MGILVTTRVRVGFGGGEMADFNYDTGWEEREFRVKLIFE